MRPFEFATAGRILVGHGRAAELPEVLAGLGSRVLVCTGADPARHAGLLAGLGLPAAQFSVGGEPTVDLARAGAAAAREHGADVVAAIGGGSVIDTGKAVAMLLGNGGDPRASVLRISRFSSSVRVKIRNARISSISVPSNRSPGLSGAIWG